MTTVANLVQQTSSSTGTGNLTLTAADGRQTFNAAFGTGGTDVFYYFVMNRAAAEWEVGTGHLFDSTTLVRDTVLNSSNANAAVNFSAGTKDVTNAVEKSDIAQLINLASTANGKGASLIGVEDSGALIAATTVEGALAELATTASQKLTRSGTVVANQLAAWVDNTQVKAAADVYVTATGLGVGTASPAVKLDIADTTGAQLRVINTGNDISGVYCDSNRTAVGATLATFRSRWNGTDVADLLIWSATDAINKDEAYFTFRTAQSGVMQERMRITAAGNVGIGTTSPSTTLHANGPIRTASYTVGTLPAAGTVGAGSRAYVTDANATTFASTVAAGGSNKVPVYSDGSNWLIG